MAKEVEGNLRQKKGKQNQTGDEAKKSERNGIPHLIGNIVGIVLCVILLPFVIVNLTLVIKSYIYPDKVPTFLGVAPMIVTSGSMEPAIKLDDLVFTREVAQETLKEGDVIAYLAKPEGPVITHRIVYVDVSPQGWIRYVMKGDNNNAADQDPVVWEQVVGKFWFRIGGAGYYALFMKEPIGMVIFVGIPLALFVIYDAIRRALYSKKTKKEQAALLAPQKEPADWEPRTSELEAPESFAAAQDMSVIEDAAGPPDPPEADWEPEAPEAPEPPEGGEE